jgi:hypothetical protein
MNSNVNSSGQNRTAGAVPLTTHSACDDEGIDLPHVGTMVWDTALDRLGRVMDQEPTCLYLRPPGGGTEWQARPEDVEPVSASEALSPRVAEANRRSRRGRL